MFFEGSTFTINVFPALVTDVLNWGVSAQFEDPLEIALFLCTVELLFFAQMNSLFERVHTCMVGPSDED